MYCRVIACDFDGTGAAGGRLAPEVASALHRARRTGIATMLVTGRVLEDLRVALVDFSAFDAIVAENGAVLWFPEREQTIELGPTPPERFLGRLRAAGIPFKAGAVVIGTWEGHAAQALALVRESGLDLQLVFNRGALMLLPSGVDKAVGVRRALQELGRSEHNMVAFGDAENDLPLFGIAERAIAARGSIPAVAAVADEQLARPGAEGVASCIEAILDGDGRCPSPARRRLEIGRLADGGVAWLPLGERNVLVSGDPRSGKSFLSGLLAEQLIDEHYRICVLDPEGDHESLAERPRCVLLGKHLPLPAAGDLPAALRDLDSSAVVSLTSLRQDEKAAYVCAALEGLGRERADTGMPSWIVVDEAHYFFRDGGECCAGVLARTGNVILATYRPSLLSAEALDSVGTYLLRRTDVDAERYFVETLLGTRGPKDRCAIEMLSDLAGERTGLLIEGSDGPRWSTFEPRMRVSRHVHHGRKYVESGVPPGKEFRFWPCDGAPRRTVGTVREFADAVRTVPIETLRHHMLAGDFSRWMREVLGDSELARGIGKLERTVALGAQPNRAEIIDHLRDRYVL